MLLDMLQNWKLRAMNGRVFASTPMAGGLGVRDALPLALIQLRPITWPEPQGGQVPGQCLLVRFGVSVGAILCDRFLGV